MFGALRWQIVQSMQLSSTRKVCVVFSFVVCFSKAKKNRFGAEAIWFCGF